MIGCTLVVLNLLGDFLEMLDCNRFVGADVDVDDGCVGAPVLVVVGLAFNYDTIRCMYVIFTLMTIS